MGSYTHRLREHLPAKKAKTETTAKACHQKANHTDTTWCGLQEESVPLSDGLTWARRIPKLDGLEGLYLEFINLDASALRSMQHLRELRLFFDEWDTSNIAAFASMPELNTLFLEPARKDILQPSMLLGLGQNVRQVSWPQPCCATKIPFTFCGARGPYTSQQTEPMMDACS